MTDHNNPYEIWLARCRDTSVSDDFADRIMGRIAADQCVPAKPMKRVKHIGSDGIVATADHHFGAGGAGGSFPFRLSGRCGQADCALKSIQSVSSDLCQPELTKGHALTGNSYDVFIRCNRH